MIGHLSELQVEHVLKSNILGRLGCQAGEKVYVVPVNYVYDGKFIIAHSIEGMKIKIMRKNPAVCFTVDEIKSFTNWKSVIAWGKYEELQDTPEKSKAMQTFADRLTKIKISETAKASPTSGRHIDNNSLNGAKSVVFRIAISEKTGRFESEAR